AIFGVPFNASDAELGVQYVELYYRKDGQGAYVKYGTTFTNSPISFDSGTTGGDGIYEFYTVATDNSSNSESAPSVADAMTRVFGSFSGSRVYVDCNASGSETGLSWTDSFKTIDVAAFVANAFAVASVWVADGTYSESVTLLSGVSLYGGFAGTETDLSQRNVVSNETTIDASLVNGGSPAMHAVLIRNVTQARLDGFRITGAGALGSEPGGGVLCINADDTNAVANCTITANQCGSGAGVFAQHSALRFESCLISQNNSAGYGPGAGVYLDYCEAVVLNECTISENTGSDGSGIFAYMSNVSIEDCVIRDNVATSYSSLGGGIHFRYGESLLVTNTLIEGNFAGWCGGGAYIYEASPVFTNVIFNANVSQWGGAAVSSYYAEPEFVNCNITNNVGTACGGFWAYYGSKPSFTNTIFQGNNRYAINAYGLSAAPPVTNCLFYNNADGDYFIDGYSPTPFIGAAQINAAVPGASGNIDGDAQFVNSSVGDFRLSNLSPCVDSGTDLDAPLFDFAGDLRPHDVPGRGADSTGKEFDIGAFENQDTGVYTPTNTPTQTATPLPTGVTGVHVWEEYR
ncbi:MAG TPA: right-handed parallel beta-helix repeat-containing protein, partial [bacterium]|nr:right-handed parallel beta-helix repeat-containing protein [bacterium]